MRNLLFATLLGSLLISAIADAQTYPPVWNNTNHYVAGDMVTDYGNVYRCIAPVNTSYLDPSKTYKNWELNYVRSGTTILIGNGQPFPSLKTAWTYMENATVAKGAYLHLNISTAVSPYHETITGTSFVLNHPFGPNISITGDVASNITFNTGSESGFEVDTGYTFGSLSNIALAASSASQTSPSFGLLANGGIFASVGNVSVSGFACGMEATNYGQIMCASQLVFGQNQGAQVLAQLHGSITLANNQVLTWPGMNPAPSPCLAESVGGYIQAVGCTISGYVNGIQAQETGSIVAPGCSISNCTACGVFSDTGALVDVAGAKLSGNNTDLEARMGGNIDGSNSTYSTTSIDTTNGSYIWGI